MASDLWFLKEGQLARNTLVEEDKWIIRGKVVCIRAIPTDTRDRDLTVVT